MKNRFPSIMLIGALVALAPRHARAQATATGSGSGSSVPGTALRPATAPLPSNSQLLADLARAEAQNNGELLVYSYGQAVRDPVLAGATLSHLMVDYYRLRSQSITATQATQAVDEALLRFALLQAAQNQLTVQQNQRIIEQNDELQKQNQRMIALLEVIAKK